MPGAHDTPFFDHAANYTGHEMQPPRPLSDPQNVVQAIVALAQDPGNEPSVDGVATIVTKHRKPGGSKKPPLAIRSMPTDTPGAVLLPVPQGTGVSAGRR